MLKKQSMLVLSNDDFQPWRKTTRWIRSPFDQLEEIVNAVGDKIDVIVRRHQKRHPYLKALSLGAKACSGGRMYLYALAAGGQRGVEIALNNLKRN